MVCIVCRVLLFSCHFVLSSSVGSLIGQTDGSVGGAHPGTPHEPKIQPSPSLTHILSPELLSPLLPCLLLPCLPFRILKPAPSVLITSQILGSSFYIIASLPVAVDAVVGHRQPDPLDNSSRRDDDHHRTPTGALIPLGEQDKALLLLLLPPLLPRIELDRRKYKYTTTRASPSDCHLVLPGPRPAPP